MTDRDSKLARLFLEVAAVLHGGGSGGDGRDGPPSGVGNASEAKKAKGGYRFDVAPYGKKKGVPFVEHSTDELLWWEERFLEELADPARVKWTKNAQRQLDGVRSILKERRVAHANAEADQEADD